MVRIILGNIIHGKGVREDVKQSVDVDDYRNINYEMILFIMLNINLI